jgi:hypothetical protein
MAFSSFDIIRDFFSPSDLRLLGGACGGDARCSQHRLITVSGTALHLGSAALPVLLSLGGYSTILGTQFEIKSLKSNRKFASTVKPSQMTGVST